MTDTTAYDEQDRERDLGALSRLFSFEEVDDAIDLLERLARYRAEEDAVTDAADTHYQGGLKINTDVYAVIHQLRAVRQFNAIPEAALEAALAAAGYPLEDDEAEDGHEAASAEVTP